MTLEEKIIELQSVNPPLSREEIIAEVEKFKASQPKVGIDSFAEEAAKKQGVVEQTDATVTPDQTPEASESEDTVSQSDQPLSASLSQQVSDFSRKIQSKPVDKTKVINDYLQKEYEGVPKIDEVVTANDYQYKYQADVDEEGNLDMQVLYKGPEDEDFINASEKARNNPKNIKLQNAEASILSQLGFLPEEIKEQAVAQLQPQQAQPQDFDPNREGAQSFDDVLFYDYLTRETRREAEISSLGVKLAEADVEKAQTRLDEIRKKYPDADKYIEELRKQKGNYELEKAKIQEKINNLPAGEVKKLKQYQQELSDLEEKYSDVSLLEGASLRIDIDKKLSDLESEISTRAYESSIIKEEEEPSYLNLLGEKIRSNIPSVDIAGISDPGSRAVATFVADALDPTNVEAQTQLDFYNQAKAAYAKEKNIDISEVTNEMVQDEVIDMYIKKYTEEEKSKLYEDIGDKELIESDFVLSTVLGVKSFEDLFGDTTQEKREELIAAVKNLDLKKETAKIYLGREAVAFDTMKKTGLALTTYSTEEEAAAAREKIRLLNLDINANYNIVEKSFDSISEKTKTTEDAELFNDLYSRNYGWLTNTAGSIATSTVDLFVNGLLEQATRLGVTDFVLAANPFTPNPILAKKLGVPTQGRIATEKIINSTDGFIQAINQEMAVPKEFSKLESGQDWARWLGTSFGQQVPIYAVLSMTGGTGLGLIAAATSGNKFREMQEEIDLGTSDYNIYQMYAAATLTGVSAAATEYVTQGMLKRLDFAYKNLPGFKTGFNETMKGFLSSAGRWARDMGEEIPSEMLDNLVGNIADRYILGKKDVNLFDNMAETAFSTLWTAGVAIRMPLIGKQLVAPFRSKQSYQVVGENTSRIKYLTNKLNTDKNLDVSAVNDIKDEINQLEVENMKALKVEFDRLDKMTSAEKKVLLENKAKEYEVKRDIQSILNNKSIDEKTKKTLLESKNKQLYNIGTSSANVLAKYVLEENKQKNMPKVEKDIETVKKFAGEDNVTVIDTEEEFAERTGKPKDSDAFIDEKTGQIFINKSWAAKVNAVTAANHELFHKIVRAKMSSDPAAAVQLVEDFKNILSDKELSIVQKRIDDNYRYVRDENGVIQKDSEGNPIENDISEYAEEYLTAYSDAIGKGEITWSDNLSESFLRLGKKLINFLKGKGFDQIEFETGRDVYNFIRDYQANIQKGKLTEAGQKMLTESEQFIADRDKKAQAKGGKLSITKRGQEFIDLTKEGVYNNEDLVNIINSPSSNQTDRFGAMDAVVENNWPVISKGLKFNPTGSIPMDAIKTAVTEQMQGIFPGRNKELLADFNADTAQVNTYLGSLMRQRQAEILERAKQIGGVTQEGASIDSAAARQVAAKAPTTTTVKEAKVAKKPTETVEFSQAQVEKIGAKDKAEVETKITEATKDGFKGKSITRFGETRNVPKAVADIYAGMFGLNPQTITDKTRNYQKTDSEGLTTAKQFLLKNANNDFARLPKTKDGFGKGTFLPRNVMNALYTNGKLTGTLKDYMDLIRQKPTKPIYRDAVGQTIRGLLNLHIRNRMFEDLVPTTPERLRGGAKFSITQKVKFDNRDGIVVMREIASDFANKNKIKVVFENEEINANNLNPRNKTHRKYVQNALETELWKYIPIESISKSSIVGYGSRGANFFFTSKEADASIKKAIENKNKWLKEGNKLNYDVEKVKQAVSRNKPKPSLITYSDSSEILKAKQKEKVKNNYKGIQEILQGGADAVKANPENYLPLLAIFGTQSLSTSHVVRNMAVDRGVTKQFIEAKKNKEQTADEHVDPSNEMVPVMYASMLFDQVDLAIPFIQNVYFQIGISKLQDNKLRDINGEYGKPYNFISSQVPFFQQQAIEYFKTGDKSKIPNVLVRYFNPQVNNNTNDGTPGFNANEMFIDGESIAKTYIKELPSYDQNPNNIFVQNNLIYKVLTGEITKQRAIKELDLQINTGNSQVKPALINNKTQPATLELKGENAKFSKTVVNELGVLDNALNQARKPDAPIKKIRVFDFDDTLARSKSKVLYTVQNVEGGFSEGATKLKAIFMVGGPGAGKTNVGKGLQLGRRGYKVVNQDIALEAMKEEAGLPAKESDYNAEQRSTRSKLGAAARKAAVAKFDKYAAAGNGMVIDGTGASYNATTKKIKALQDQGFEVHMVVATTPLETAIERNKARTERSLPDFVVKKTYESVQESLKRYREDFGDRLYEINTETIEYGKPLPDEFLQEVYAGINTNKVGKVDATSFAENYDVLESQGAEFDFREFSRVIEGEKGPLFSVAQKIAAARGTDDVFILTARPADAAKPIQEFMKANGIDIPLQNITGLGDGTAAAKGRWIAGKAAEGYNDFYFADDAVKNVQAVKDVLSQVDVKSKVQQAKFSKTGAFDRIFNDIIEKTTGIESYKDYSAAKAKTVGASKGRFDFLIPPSAEDFVGLLYKTLSKGKVGDAQMAFYKDNLIDPYNRAEMAISQAKVAAGRDYKALKKQFKNIPKTLEKETGIAKYSYQHAIRTYIWDSQGLEVPGLSKRDQKRLTDFVKADPQLQAFADQLVNLQKGKPYPKPDKNWTAGNITTDVISGINKVNRAEYLQEWQENVDIIFSEKNMNKLEAAFGAKYVEALKDSLRAMKSGSNRPLGGDRISNQILDWLNNSVGAIMFLNTRSAVLQTISAVNFINWGDNNILKAGKAFANQKQFWSDFLTLMNSDYLLERRDGLKINVSESEIADAVEGSKNKVQAAIAYLLNKGFVLTRYADSFAIASGGATFYRNRIESLVEQGMDRKAAEQQAFEDFRLIAEENQQSSSPMRISQQQRSLIGRIVLQFGNTQLQYVRIQKRAVQDLINGRGDWRSNISKIVYYGAVQNLLFNALQSGLAWAMFDDDEEDEELTEKNKEQKLERALNGAIDSQLKGLGIQGAVIAGVKNALITIAEQADKKSPKFEEALDDLLSIAPSLGSKIRKIKSATRTVSWNRKEIKEKGFSMDNPAYLAGAQVISAAFNIPLDRAVMKMNNMRNILNPATKNWQKVALALGWSGWDVGLPYFGLAEGKPVLTETEKQSIKIFDLNKSDQVKMLLDLGLTKKEIRALTKEEQRVKEIIKLQNKKKDAGSKE